MLSRSHKKLSKEVTKGGHWKTQSICFFFWTYAFLSLEGVPKKNLRLRLRYSIGSHRVFQGLFHFLQPFLDRFIWNFLDNFQIIKYKTYQNILRFLEAHTKVGLPLFRIKICINVIVGKTKSIWFCFEIQLFKV
jgi:hypothetical protein